MGCFKAGVKGSMHIGILAGFNVFADQPDIVGFELDGTPQILKMFDGGSNLGVREGAEGKRI